VALAVLLRLEQPHEPDAEPGRVAVAVVVVRLVAPVRGLEEHCSTCGQLDRLQPWADFFKVEVVLESPSAKGFIARQLSAATCS
jgi:hypothetical protein